MHSALSILTITIFGLTVGVGFFVAFVMNPIIHAWPFGLSMTADPHGGRMLGRVMPIWFMVSLALPIVMTIGSWGSSSALALLLASILPLISVVMSITLLVPINNRVKTWTAESHPENWRELRSQWDNLHFARVAIIVGAFVLVVFSATQI